MKKVNSLTIDRANYETEKEFYDIIGKLISLLMDLNQIVVSRYEDANIYVVEFMPNEPEYGDYMPYWLLPEEEETIVYKEETVQYAYKTD